MKNCSFLLLAFVILASASCSGTDETVLPVQADHGTRTEDQSRLVPYAVSYTHLTLPTNSLV